MKRDILSLCAALCFSAAPARAEGFAGLGQAAQEYAQVVPGRALVFPQDFGAHDAFRTEWWYVTANLRDETGAAYGVQWTLFRQALSPKGAGADWATPQLFMAHAAATSAGRHFVAEKFARGGVGQAGVEAQPFRAFIDDWRFDAQDDALQRATISAAGAEFSFALALSAQGPIVPQGEAGYSRKSDGPQASYYFSQPFFAATGVLKLQGRDIRVSGQAWMDREWSSQPLAKNQTGWDWFALHLQSGEKIMLYRMRDDTPAGFRLGAWISAKGDPEPLAAAEIALTPLERSDVDGRALPTAWRVQIARKGFDATARALNPASWMKTRFPYWEGPVVVSGSHAGVGYLEMTGERGR